MDHFVEVNIDFASKSKPTVVSKLIEGPDYDLPHDHQLIDSTPLIPGRIDLRVISKDKLPDAIAERGILADSALHGIVIQSACDSVLYMMKDLPKEEQAAIYKALSKTDKSKLGWIDDPMYFYCYIPLAIVIVVGSILLGINK